ncbi:MAG: CPBP family intramembrane metalloprotease [Chloroflexi bacterium]|nr:MAG: CPBP family intramembrane metalloprotease [Chloroflexota bacterium]
MTSDKFIRQFAPLIPYLAVLVGLYIFSSAWLSILLYHAGIALALSVIRGWEPGKLPSKLTEWLVLLPVVAGSAAAGLVILTMWPVIKLVELSLSAELVALGLTGTVWTIFIFYYFTVNPILEEQFWRGYLGQNSLRPTLADVWFAGYHVLVLVRFARLPWVVASFLTLVAAAWFWRQLARRYGGLTFPILSHAAADAGIIGAVWLLARAAGA